MKKITTYIREHIWAYLLATAAMVISTSLSMVSPMLTKTIIDDVITGGQIARLTPLLIGIMIVGVGRMIFMYIKEYTFDLTSSKIAGEIRTDIYKHIQGLSTEFFDRNNTGDLMARVKDDVDRIWDALGFIGMLIMEVIYHVGLALFCMYSISPKIAIIPTVFMVLCGILAIVLEKKLDVIYEEISEENAKLNTVCEENLGGVRTVKAFAREKHEISKFLSHNKRFYELNMKQSDMFVKYHPYFTLVTKILPLVCLLFGGYLVIDGELSLGDLGAFVQYSMNVVWPMEILGWLTNSLSAAVASHRKLRKIYEEKPTVCETDAPVAPEKLSGKITFKGVHFNRGDNEILADINFEVEPGKTLGIMGATGSGKSSLVHLLQRLYDVTKGEILVDDIPIKTLPLNTLRSSVSVVMQDVFLFSDTIADNIMLGKRHALTLEGITKASKKAQASGFIDKLEKGYDTIIGERGVGLSGGQKQRISIARAIAKKSPILVMDDSTSALDMETESMIQETLDTMQGTTKIIIGHRISAVKNADEIIFLEKGQIAERGTHDELLEKKGLYYETYMAQYGAFLHGKEEDVNGN